MRWVKVIVLNATVNNVSIISWLIYYEMTALKWQSTNIDKTTSHLKLLSTQKTTYIVGNSGPSLGQAQKYGGVPLIWNGQKNYLLSLSKM